MLMEKTPKYLTLFSGEVGPHMAASHQWDSWDAHPRLAVEPMGKCNDRLRESKCGKAMMFLPRTY